MFWRFSFAFTPKSVHSRSFVAFAVYGPKMAKYDVIKPLFCLKFSTDYSENLRKDVKVMSDEVLTYCVAICHLFELSRKPKMEKTKEGTKSTHPGEGGGAR